jgi:F0F1-type ATP synthase membrane subunit b/b'
MKSLDTGDLDSASNYARQAESFDPRFSNLRQQADRAIEQRRHDEEMALRSSEREREAYSQHQKDMAETVIERERDNNLQEVCNSIDHEVEKLADLNMKLVMLELGAMADQVHPDVEIVIVENSRSRYKGDVKEAGDPAEEVLDEARERAQRIVELQARRDQLNGKAAWTQQQRAWLRDHIYVVGPDADYSVRKSIATAHGQTDFSSLNKMPAFAGCE